MGFSLSFSLNFHAHLRSTAKLNCLSLRRWTTLAMPGWQAPRVAPWMGTPTRARMTSFWWKFEPGRPPVDAPARWWELGLCSGSGGGRGATSFFHGEKHGKTLDPLARSMFWVRWNGTCSQSCRVSSHSNGPICWVHLQGRYMSISRICWKFNRCLLTSLDQIRNKPG